MEYCCKHCNTLERQLKHLKEDYAHLKAKAGKINEVIEELKHLKEDYAHLKAKAGKINEVIEELKHLKEDYAHLKAKAGKINEVIEELKHLKEDYAHLKDNYAQIKGENALRKKENTSIKKIISALAAKGINAKTNTSDNPREKTPRSKHQRCNRSSPEQVLMTRRLLIRQIVTYAVMNSQSQLIHTI